MNPVLVQNSYPFVFKAVELAFEGLRDQPWVHDSIVAEIFSKISKDLPQGGPIQFKVENWDKVYQVDATVSSNKVKEIAIRQMAPPGFPVLPPRPSVSPPLPSVETENTEEKIPSVISCSGIPFKLSYEFILGAAHLRNEDHHVSLDVLQKCLNKKTDLFRKERQKKVDSTLDLYFQDRKTLNIVVKHFPKEETPFFVQTAYYMPALSVKGRFKMNQSQFEDWFSKLPSTQ